jgi:hypothetical protein
MDLKYFEHVAKRGFYRPVAVVTFPQAVALVAEAMRYARSIDLNELLVNTSGLTGFASPDVFARYEMVGQWVPSAGAQLKVAMVCRPEIVDPQKIGVVMAQNRGIAAEVFTSESIAIAWLDAMPVAGTTRP